MVISVVFVGVGLRNRRKRNWREGATADEGRRKCGLECGKRESGRELGKELLERENRAIIMQFWIVCFLKVTYFFLLLFLLLCFLIIYYNYKNFLLPTSRHRMNSFKIIQKTFCGLDLKLICQVEGNFAFLAGVSRSKTWMLVDWLGWMLLEGNALLMGNAAGQLSLFTFTPSSPKLE